MPKEIVSHDQDGAITDRLEVHWGLLKQGLLKQVDLLTTREQMSVHRDVVSVWCLNRDEVNHLIRTLRKARDRTFGPDA